VENVRWCGRRLLDGHAGSAIKVLVAGAGRAGVDVGVGVGGWVLLPG